MQQDLYNSAVELVAVAPATISSDTTTAGIIIDTQGCESAMVNCITGVVTAGDVTLSVTESDDSGMSGATAISGDFVIGSFTANSTANTVVSTGIVAQKRYVQVSIISDNSANLVGGATITLGNPAVAGK
jgi:hypothetical protein